jgi:cyanate permease
VGPVLLGKFFDLTGSWAVPMGCILLITVVDGILGWHASKPGIVK